MQIHSIFSSQPAKGWMPWGLFAPVICILTVLATLPADRWLEHQGFIDSSGDTVGTSGLVAFLLVSFSAWGLVVIGWVLGVERRPLVTIGMPKEGAVKSFFVGHIVGVVGILIIIVTSGLAGAYRPQDIGPAFADPLALSSIALLLLCFIVQSGVEEIIFRGWLLSAITRKINLIVAIILSTALFTLLHFSPGQPPLATVNVALFSVFACCWAISANSIWGVMGWHAGWNWMLATGFEVPVTGIDADVPALLIRLEPVGSNLLTGGPQGPEGGLMCTILFSCSIGYLIKRYWEKVSVRPITEKI